MTSRLPAAALLLCALYAAPARVFAQATPPPLTYDITTIKPHKAADQTSMWSWREGTFEATNADLKNLVASAWNVRSWLITGLPPWTESARYDIQGKISEADPAALKALTNDQRRALLAALLQDRFGLKVHEETKLQPVFELTVVPEGLKLHETPPLPAPTDDTPKPERHQTWSVSNSTMKATDTPVHTIAENLSYQVQRVILDKTNLTGTYDFELKWTPADDAATAADKGLPADAPPDIFTALKQQLGLKLTPAKAPVPTIVIDQITQPEPN